MENQKIKAKKLKRKAEAILQKIRDIELCNGLPNIQMLSQPHETKQCLWRCIDEMKRFIDNIQ